jgi:1-deoxy-D-xylulose-5-phosphate reductoisomerase
VLVLGSTGSIGTQALEVIAGNPQRFRVVGLAAGGGRPELVAHQALRFGVEVVAVSAATAVEDLQLAFYRAAQEAGYDRGEFALPKILAGPEAIGELIDGTEADVVLNGITGSRGLEPTLRALATGSTLALANKESLVAGGPLVLAAAREGQLVPVDSEHSAIAQCLRSGSPDEVAKLVVTASGGPFRGRSRSELAEVTVDDALAHPTWAMGPVVTLNSATLVNKGLEVIEAHLLFGVPYEKIDVVVHPQSIVHSMVTFTDGATIAKASPPDMKLPIALAMGWPHRVADVGAPLDLAARGGTWTFEPLDDETFPAVSLARHVGVVGGCLPAVYNAANEEAVGAFVRGNTAFTSIVDTVSQVVEQADGWRADPREVAEVLAAEQWARARCAELLCR